MNSVRQIRVLLATLVVALAFASGAHAQCCCGDLNNDGFISHADYTLLVDYLYNDGPEPYDLWRADWDYVAGITNSDLLWLQYYMYVSFPGMSCGVTADTFAVSTNDTTFVRNTLVPPSAQHQVVEVWHRSDDLQGVYPQLTGYSLPFSYACSTSAITLDSIVPTINPAHLRATIDSTNQKALFMFSVFASGEPHLAGKHLLARLYFTLATPDPLNSQRILVDTTDYAPSHTFVATELWHISTRPTLYGTVGTDTQPPSCCVGETGDVNGDGNRTISDLTVLINFLFVTFEPLPCPAAGNTFGDEKCYLNLTDVSRLVSRLFVTFVPTDYCDQFDNFICGQFY